MPPVHASASDSRPSGLAIAGLVFGVLGFVSLGLFGLVGLIISIISIISIMAQSPSNRSGGHIEGRGVATAGIITSAASLLLGCVMAGLLVLLLPALGKARESALSLKDMTQLKQVGTAMMIHAAENQGRLPAADTWPRDLIDMELVNESLYQSSFAQDAGRAFAMNASLGGVRDADIPEPELTVLLFECEPGSPPAGGPELFAAEPHMNSGYLVLFADGNVMRVTRDNIPMLIWRLDE